MCVFCFLFLFFLTHLHSTKLSGVRLSCNVIPCWVSTSKFIELGWEGLGAAGTKPNCWFKH